MNLQPKTVDLLTARCLAPLSAAADGLNAGSALAADHGAPPGAPVR